MSEQSNAVFEVALFPIPNVVAFPGTVLPLHVFEPRYRQLVGDAVKDDRMVGVSHVIKTIHEPKKQQTVEQMLNSNQATYKPREVFSAGPCTIVETTSDGRIIARIDMAHRVTLDDEVQSLPYRIVSCSVLLDEDKPAHDNNAELQKLINNFLVAAIRDRKPELADKLAKPEWAELDPTDYSFRVFQFVQFEPDLMQQILETQVASARLQMIWDRLRSS